MEQLPPTFSEVGFDVAVKGGESLDFTIVIGDRPDNCNQRWKVDVPSSTGHHQCSVDVSADPDGVLEVTLRYIDGFQTNIKGRLSRERSGRSKLLFRGQNPGGLAQEDRQRITPEQFVSAMTALRTGRRDWCTTCCDCRIRNRWVGVVVTLLAGNRNEEAWLRASTRWLLRTSSS